MSNGRRHDFVLVHGAWHGGWVWRDVIPGLHALGHEASAPTLTGLGERRHIGTGSIGLEDHVEDLVAHIEMEDLRDITLVGWSYGGMVITGALARLSERIRGMVYLDAFVPEDGEAAIDYIPPQNRVSWDACRDADRPLPPIPLPVFGVTDPALVAFIEPRLAPQPWRTFYQPVKALKSRPDIPMSYVACSGYGQSPFMARLAEMEADPAMRTIVIDTSHHCMLTAVEETVAALVESRFPSL
jgi:pimeloyl-ACP methyl ester carboxylesterase